MGGDREPTEEKARAARFVFLPRRLGGNNTERQRLRPETSDLSAATILLECRATLITSLEQKAIPLLPSTSRFPGGTSKNTPRHLDLLVRTCMYVYIYVVPIARPMDENFCCPGQNVVLH